MVFITAAARLFKFSLKSIAATAEAIHFYLVFITAAARLFECNCNSNPRLPGIYNFSAAIPESIAATANAVHFYHVSILWGQTRSFTRPDKHNKTILTVRKMAKIRKQYNQVPHLTQDTTCESNKNTINITNKSQEVSLSYNLKSPHSLH